MLAPFPIDRVRARFPGLARTVHGTPAVFLDGPAGSQVPQSVIDAVAETLTHRNANTGGSFVTSREVEVMLREARAAAADFIGAADPDEIVFGPNMTTLTFQLSRALSQTWKPGDEIVITRLDHDANVTPWTSAATSAGATVRFVELTPSGNLDPESLRRVCTARTRLLAFTAASNLIGTLPEVRAIVAQARAVGALTFVDAVHYAAHRRIDVAAWGCDLLACSVYKFFGPHVGILWGRSKLLSDLRAEKVRPAKDALPYRWMQGTPNHEGIAGARAAIEYLAALGREVAGATLARGAALTAAFDAIVAHETSLGARLLQGLANFSKVRVVGDTDPARAGTRAPTVSFTHQDLKPREISALLGEHGIFTWAGHAYALELSRALHLEPDGVVRVGCLHYNTAAEVDRLLAALGQIGR